MKVQVTSADVLFIPGAMKMSKQMQVQGMGSGFGHLHSQREAGWLG